MIRSKFVYNIVSTSGLCETVATENNPTDAEGLCLVMCEEANDDGAYTVVRAYAPGYYADDDGVDYTREDR